MTGVLGALIGASGGTVADATQTTAFLARTTGLDATHTNAYRALINGLVTDNVFSAFDALYIFATQDATTSLLNLVSTSFNATAVATPTFTADRGYTGNGTTQYIDTNFSPSNQSATSQYQLASAHYSHWGLTNATPNGGTIGYDNNGASWQFFSGATFPRVNDGGGSFTPATQIGHNIANRASGTSRQAYQNGSQVDSTTVSNDVSYQSLANFAVLGYGVNMGLTTNQVAMASIGRGLTGTEITNFYTRLRTFMTTVGVP